MRRFGTWVLTLGILAATPAVSMAGPLSLFKANKDKPAASANKQMSNQQMAEQIAEGLRVAQLEGYEIEIEVQKGTALLKGKIASGRQKQKATKIASMVQGVRRVDNRMQVMADRPRASQNRNVQLAGHHVPASKSGSAAENQQTAERIAEALREARLNGFDIEIRFQNGTATLSGAVGTPQQRAHVTQVVSSVPGVASVNNRIQVAGRRGAAPHGPIQQVAYQPQPGGPEPQPGGPGPQYGQPAMPAPPQYGHPGSGASHQAYDMPNLPDYAWPAYAAYPNSAQLTYPKQYSASAWPYIGPFYPYPQIPMGWRETQLEWDDGHWNLNFRPRTDKWWWFLDPKNW